MTVSPPSSIVATSAFGLGVNRPDVRTVMCVSPPTDLAALYQQIGRAGRADAAPARPVQGPANSGLALATSRGMRMVRFLTDQGPRRPLLRRMGALVLAQNSGSLDPVRLADLLMDEDVESGDLTEADLADRHTHELYQGGVMRAFSALADLGAVDDLGDHPPLCRGQVRGPRSARRRPLRRSHCRTAESLAVERIVIGTALASGHPRARRRPAAGQRTRLRIAPPTGRFAEGPAATWELLADLHDRGLLDVSAAPSRRLVTGLVVRADPLPGGFLALLQRRGRRAAEEFGRLRAFFEASSVCAQRIFADYFGAAELPEGCCETARCRCSACWDTGSWPADQRRPAVADAFHHIAAPRRWRDRQLPASPARRPADPPTAAAPAAGRPPAPTVARAAR